MDAYPLVEDRDIRVTFHEKGSADEVLVKDLISAAKSGAASAQVELGQRYGDGDGVEQDDTVAFDLYTRAAALGHPMGLTSSANASCTDTARPRTGACS